MTSHRRALAAPVAARAGCARVLACLWLLLVVLEPGRAVAQGAAPLAPTAEQPGADGARRLSAGVEASVSAAPEDDRYFNYSTEGYSALRAVRIDASGQARAASWLSLVGDVRVQAGIGEGGTEIRLFALFARIHPWAGKSIDIQAGLIPPVFGASSRRAYGAANPLVGLPLGYQYLTSLRPDALPASADDLLSRRGRGWLVRYPIGDAGYGSGVPLVDGLRYPTGIEIHAGDGRLEASAALTTGSASTPSDRSLAHAPQLSGRLAARPAPGLVVGFSVSHGTFVASSLADVVGRQGGSSANDQTAAGLDAEYAIGHWIVRGEGIYSRWRIPRGPGSSLPSGLRALALDVEARYRVTPRLYAAVRVGSLGFSEACGTRGCLPWEAPVQRAEAGAGYSIRRNIVVKGAYQYNARDGASRETEGLASAQVVVWF